MYDFNKCLKKKITNWENHTEGISLHKEDMIQIKNDSHQPKLARVIAIINPSTPSINPTTYTSSLILDPIFQLMKHVQIIVQTLFLEDGLVFLVKSVIKNGLYKELPMMKCCVYILYTNWK